MVYPTWNLKFVSEPGYLLFAIQFDLCIRHHHECSPTLPDAYILTHFTVNMFVHYLYNRSPLKGNRDFVESTGTLRFQELTHYENNKTAHLLPIGKFANMMRMKLYIFADRFSIPSLQRIVRQSQAYYGPDAESVIYAVDHLPDENDPIYGILAKNFINFGVGDEFEMAGDGPDTEKIDEYPDTFLVHVVRAYAKDRAKRVQEAEERDLQATISYNDSVAKKRELRS